MNTQEQATAVAEGQFDTTKYRQSWASDPVPNDPVTVAGSLGPNLKWAIADALLKLSPSDVAQVGSFLDVNPPGDLSSGEVSPSGRMAATCWHRTRTTATARIPLHAFIGTA